MQDSESHEQGNYNAHQGQRSLRRNREGHGPGTHENRKEMDASRKETVEGEQS